MYKNLKNKIAEGGCSEIYEWENGSKIIKLAKDNTGYEAMKREYENNFVAWKNNLPVPKPYDFVEVNGRQGIILERINVQTLMERFLKKIMKQKNKTHYVEDDTDIRITARILSKIHNETGINIQSLQKDHMKYSINSVDYLNEGEKKEIISIVDNLPAKQVLCHGDPNPNNIIVSNNGKIVIIDWMNAAIGNPEADLAEYIVMVKYAVLPSDIPERISDQFDLIREKIIDIFMDEYTKLTGISYKDVCPWIIPVAARKLSADAISEEEKELLVTMIRDGILA